MANTLLFIKTYASFILFALLIVLAFLYFNKYNEYKQLKADKERQENQFKGNIIAMKDSIDVEYNKKLKAFIFSKDAIVVDKLKELEQYNKELKNQLVLLKGDVIDAIDSQVHSDLGGISTIGDELKVLDEKTNSYGLKFKKHYEDEGFEQNIVGTTKFHMIPNDTLKKWFIKPDVTSFDTLTTDIKITYGFRNNKGVNEVYAISPSTKLKIVELNGAYIIDKQPTPSPVIPKRWGIGPYIGYGINTGVNSVPTFGWSMGVAVHYDILQFNFPKLGK